MDKPSKTVCPVTAADFITKAEPLQVKVGDRTILVPPKEFSSGSFGWYMNEKVQVTVDGKPLTVQIGANFVVANSKEAERK